MCQANSTSSSSSPSAAVAASLWAGSFVCWRGRRSCGISAGSFWRSQQERCLCTAHGSEQARYCKEKPWFDLQSFTCCHAPGNSGQPVVRKGPRHGALEGFLKRRLRFATTFNKRCKVSETMEIEALQSTKEPKTAESWRP